MLPSYFVLTILVFSSNAAIAFSVFISFYFAFFSAGEKAEESETKSGM